MAIRKFVLLVAGHGGGDPGATGQGTTEAQETVKLVDKAYALLASHPNIVVEMVPHSMDFVDSVAWANANYKNLEDGIVIEVHKNSFGGRATGNETLIPAGSDATSKKLGRDIVNGINQTTGLADRGVKERGDLYLIREITMYATLVECGFIGTDPVSDDFNNKWALGIANGVCDFFGEARVGAPAPKPAPAPAPAPTPAPAPVAASYTKIGTLTGVGDVYKKA